MRHIYIDCHHLLHQYLSLNQLSPTTRSKTKQKYKRKEKKRKEKRRTPILHYTKERKSRLFLYLLPSQVSAGLYIGKRRFYKTRRGRTSKIDAWLAKMAAETRSYQGLRSLVLASGFVSLWGSFRYSWIQVFAPKFSSDTRQHRD